MCGVDTTDTPLTTRLAGMTLRGPLVLSSGVMGLSAASLKRIAEAGAGAVTSKSCGLTERMGHKNPVIVPFAHGILNAVGLSNPGVEDMSREITQYKRETGVPLIASIFGTTIEEFGVVAEHVLSAKPDMVEVNVSCPNVAAEFGRPFGADPEACGRITRLIKEKAGKTPVTMKLTASCDSISRMARVCEDNGADAITLINSIGPGMLIDLNVRRPLLSNRSGGVSGACVLPIAIRCVYDVFRVVKIPLIGGGGVETAEDALQLIMAGATAIGIASGLYKGGIEVFDTINREIANFLKEKGVMKLSDLRGVAHE
ncbi:MAG: dihydroorotate dehydrogenase [Candidatus Ozemobacteraceae bacterium]